MRCGKCGSTENLLIHSRKFRVTTCDYYIRYYCRKCQNARVLKWLHERRPQMRMKDGEEYTRVAEDLNNRLMKKYLTRANN